MPPCKDAQTRVYLSCGLEARESISLESVSLAAGVKAKSQKGRAAPMVGLLLVRGGAVLARIFLRTGSMTASYCYLAMEVGSPGRPSD